MAKKILIVHGYSDGSTSFTGLGEFFIRHKLYLRENVFYLDYSSMDDQATFRDFADKLDADHRVRLGNERGEVIVHVAPREGQQSGVVVVEGIWPNRYFENGIGINSLTSADPGWPNGGAVFHDTAVWIRRIE